MSIIPLPPPQYDHVYAHELVEIIDDKQARNYCGSDKFGCEIKQKETCFIIMRKLTDPVAQDMLRRHETGHCNGWPVDHPDPQPGW